MKTKDEKELKSEILKVFKEYKYKSNYINIINNHINIERFEPWISEINLIKKIDNKTSILSSGCGSAGDLYYFSKYNPKKLYGIEVDPKLALLANKRMMFENIKNYKIDIYDGKILPYKKNTFDIIFSMHVIEHTTNPTIYINELFRVLKPKGIIFLELPNKYYPKEQHTNKYFLHWFNKNKIILFLIKNKIIKNVVNIPSPKKIYKTFKNQKKSKIIQSIFHSYDNKNIKHNFKNLYIPLNKTTYRIVVLKTS